MLFKKEMKINFKSFLIWTLSLLSFVLVIFLIYPEFSKSTTDLDKMLESMPKELLKLFNMDIVSIQSVSGWFLSEGYLFITLIGGCYAGILGGTIVLKEENDKTIEFLYSKPISKNFILRNKILVGLIYITIFNLIIGLTTFIGFKVLNDFEFTKWLLMIIGPLLLHMIFYFVIMFLSIFLKRNKRATGISIGIVLGTYILQILSTLSDKIEFLKYLSPYEYFNSRSIIVNSSFEFKYILLTFIIIIGSIIGIFYKYNKKEFL